MATTDRISETAAALIAAETNQLECEPLTDTWPDLLPAVAYDIQDAALRIRLARGEHLVGVKLGLTSVAKQRQMNVDSPLTAWLTDAMALEPGAAIPRNRLIHARAEPEIVFYMGDRLAGPGVTRERALAAVAAVGCGIEILDSRYRDFRFKLADVIADNASSAFFFAGLTRVSPSEVDLSAEKCEVIVGGTRVAEGFGRDVQGHPAEALALAANSLSTRGHAIEAGWVVLTGGMTDAVVLPCTSTFEVRFAHLGDLIIRSSI